MSEALNEINELVQKESVFVESVIKEVNKVIVGQRHVIESLLIGVFTGRHILLEGVPGLAKTLLVHTLASVTDARFSRLQFTPDLLPADLIGTMIYDHEKKSFSPKLGPIFSNFVLADEINRAPAKVQSALLEAMQEKQVTLGDKTYKLKEPFLVMATQNPVDQDGTYTLPEAQIDRFLLKLNVGYPTKEEEKVIMNRMAGKALPAVNKVVTPEDILRAKQVVSKVYVDEKIKDYILDIVRATREPEEYNIKGLKPLIQHGASPRASISLIEAAKAHAFIQKRGFVTPDDVKAVGRDVLRHRVIPSFEAEAEDVDSDAIIDRLFSEIEVP